MCHQRESVGSKMDLINELPHSEVAFLHFEPCKTLFMPIPRNTQPETKYTPPDCASAAK